MATQIKSQDKKPEPKAAEKETTSSITPFTAEDMAKEMKLPSTAITRRYLRASKVEKPKDGWSWPSRDAAKPAIEAVKRAVEAQTPKT